MSRVLPSVFRAALTSLVLAGALGTGAAFAGTDVGSINFILGRKSLTGEWRLDQSGVDSTARVGQPSLGVEMTWGREGWPAQIALDVLHSYDDGVTHVPRFFTVPPYDVRLRARTIEIGLGARRDWSVLGCSPYLAAGGSWVRGSYAIEVSDPDSGQFGVPTASAHARQSAFGYWAGGGIYRRLGPRFQIGLAGRYSKATLPATPLVVESGTIPNSVTAVPELDGGGRHINLVVGWSFPSRK